jgi:dCMP deaminase
MVVLLITGHVCSGKETLANMLKNEFGYKIHKLESSSFTNLWSYETNSINEQAKEQLLKESNDKLNEVLSDWQSSHVIYPVLFSEPIKTYLLKRSYIKIISINAPMMTRYKIFLKKYKEISLEDFININDSFSFNLGVEQWISKSTINFTNDYNLDNLKAEIDIHPLIVNKIFRPNWDNYFMKLAHIVKQRSNCMKRSVGAIIVHNHRIISTGYNGVPGKFNCHEGGCPRCNSNIHQGDSLGDCNCIHAEEAAVLEEGVHRSKGATLYTTLAPCRWCAKVIIAAGIIRVVYDERYSHEESEGLLRAQGIEFDRININP